MGDRIPIEGASARSDDIATTFRAEAASGVAWSVTGATVLSRLSEPYVATVDIESEDATAEPLELLGSSAALTVRHGARENTYSGLVSAIRTTGRDGTRVNARLTIEPALAALRHGRDSRIFQNQGVDAILTSVLEAQLAPFRRTVRSDLSRAYPSREYTVQYQESHFDFVHRLMEEEGIYYYFEGEGEAETLVLMDGPNMHPEIDDGPLLEFAATEGGTGLHDREYVRRFAPVARVLGTQVATRHFDWTHPSAMVGASVTANDAGELPHGAASGPDRESYEHDEPMTLSGFASSYQANDAAAQAQVRRDAQARDARLFEATTSVTTVRAGVRFDLNGHPDVALNGSYAVVAVRHQVRGHVAEADGAHRYTNECTVVPIDVAYRPQRTRSRQRIQGIQTAIVTGPAGEEIHTDEHGRIKVQFHWDRQGAYDDKTSCWMRVAQNWSGGGFGGFVLPRIGMEVVVSFIDGDPDRPLVTGCVYNGDNPGPYAMPDQKMCSGFKTNSYPGGGGYNELRFDDTKGGEEIWIQGEKDWNTLIKNDLTRDVLHDEIQNVVNNRTRTVGVDETLTVHHDRTRLVDNDETVTVSKNRTKTVGVNEMLNVGVNRVRNVGATETVTVGVAQNVTVGAVQNITVGAAQNETIGESRTTAVGSADSLMVAADRDVSVAGNQKTEIGESETRKVGSSLTEKVKGSRTRNVATMETVMVGVNQAITVGAGRQVMVGGIQKMVAGVSFEIVCGESSIKLEKGGKVTIKGAEFEFAASGEVKINGSMIDLN